MSRKQVLTMAVVVAVLAALAYLQFRTWRNFEWGVFWQQTRQASLPQVATGILLIYCTYILRALRWKVMLRPSKDVPASQLLGPMVIGFTGLALLGRPGDLIRPYLIARRQGLSFPSQVAALAVERVLDIGCFALLLVLDLLFAKSLETLPYYQEFRFAGFALCVAVVFAIAGVWAVWRHGEGVSRWVHRTLDKVAPKMAEGVAERIRIFGVGLHTMRDLRSFVEAVGLSLAIWVIIGFAYVQVTHAYGDSLRTMAISQVLLLMSASIAGSLLQLPVVGGGSQLGTITVLRAVFDVSHELALSCGIMLWLVTFVAVVPVGLIWAKVEHVSLVQAEEESLREKEKVIHS